MVIRRSSACDAELGGQFQDRFAGDAVQDRPAQRRRDQLAVHDEEDVHGADFFDIAVLAGIQPEDLAVTLLRRFARGQQAAGVIAAGLGFAGAAAAGAGIGVADPQADRVEPLLEIGPDRGEDDIEQVGRWRA